MDIFVPLKFLKTTSFMNIHEYQGKSILSKFGVAIPFGLVAESAEEAWQSALEIREKTGTHPFFKEPCSVKMDVSLIMKTDCATVYALRARIMPFCKRRKRARTIRAAAYR